MATKHFEVLVHSKVQNVQQENKLSLKEIADVHLQARIKEAFDAGREEGLASHLESGRVALEQVAANLDKTLELLPTQAVELAVAIASELLAVEVRAESYDLERIVRGALGASDVGRGACIVHVCPADAERLSSMVWRAGTEVEQDPSLKPGDVHITTPRGLLIRELEPALASIREHLLEDLG
ncbi:MAG: flagellar biosynthesis/type III secretory pathway protein FliH [Planctomycetota bacterium]|jgi:flagellar biosynthesis/type III secretory pathway protein FliH